MTDLICIVDINSEKHSSKCIPFTESFFKLSIKSSSPDSNRRLHSAGSPQRCKFSSVSNESPSTMESKYKTNSRSTSPRVPAVVRVPSQVIEENTVGVHCT